MFSGAHHQILPLSQYQSVSPRDEETQQILLCTHLSKHILIHHHKKYRVCQMSNIILSTSTPWFAFVFWAEYKGKPRKEAVANFRLKTVHDCLEAHLRKIGIYESSECTICQCQTQPQMRNIYCIALNLISTNKFSRIPSNSNGMPE